MKLVLRTEKYMVNPRVGPTAVVAVMMVTYLRSCEGHGSADTSLGCRGQLGPTLQRDYLP